MTGVNEKIRLLIFHPKEFYLKVRNEKGYKGPLLFYAILLIMVSFIGLILDFIADLMTQHFENLFFLLVSVVYSLFLIAAVAFVLPFIFSAFTHIGLKILRVKSNFQLHPKIAFNTKTIRIIGMT